MRNWFSRHPIWFMAFYLVFYLSVFHWLEVNITVPEVWVHCHLDDLIPFCKYAVIPYLAWFIWIPFTLFYLLWKAPRADFWRLCLPLFAGMTIALAENAAANGIKFRFDTRVDAIRREGDHFVLSTTGGEMETRTVISAAGVYGDVLHNQLCPDDPRTIVPRKGEYCLLDRRDGALVGRTIFQLPIRETAAFACCRLPPALPCATVSMLTSRLTSVSLLSGAYIQPVTSPL